MHAGLRCTDSSCSTAALFGHGQLHGCSGLLFIDSANAPLSLERLFLMGLAHGRQQDLHAIFLFCARRIGLSDGRLLPDCRNAYRQRIDARVSFLSSVFWHAAVP